MKTFSITIATLLALVAGSCSSGNATAENDKASCLERAKTPGHVSAAADSLWNQASADSLEIHSLMIVNDGKVIYESWRNGADANTKHILNSVSKTYTSIAVGLAIEEGKLSLDEKVVDIFPEYLPDTVSRNLADMDVRDLLTMTCGHATDHTYEMRRLAKTDTTFNWIKQFLAYPVEYRPGVIYCYNSVGTLMLSAIVQKPSERTYSAISPRACSTRSA